MRSVILLHISMFWDSPPTSLLPAAYRCHGDPHLINLTEGEGTALAGGTPARAAAGGAEQSEDSPGGAGKRKHAVGQRAGLRPPAPARSPPLRLGDRVTTRLQRVVSWRVAGAPGTLILLRATPAL